MKKLTKLFASVLMFTALPVFMTGCTTTGNNFFGTLKGVVIGDDYEAAGKMVGEAGYMAYVIMKGNPKYDKYTSKMEEVYKTLDEAGLIDTVSINQTILEVAQVALSAKYGYVYGTLITDGIRVGGVVADRMIMKNVSAESAKLYAKGILEGVNEARAKTPASALDAAEAQRQEKLEKEKAKAENKEAELEQKKKDEWAKPIYITCKPVKICPYKFSNRKLSVQKRIAQELDKFGFLDPNEEPADEYSITKYKNVKDFIARCERLEKFNVKKVNVWISYVRVNCKWKVDENGKEILDEKGNKIADCKLEAITFLWEDSNGNIMETDCVSCMDDTELDDLTTEVASK